VSTQRQRNANRANARRSTGPKTSEGKRAVRLNGLRHGLLSHDVVLPGEDEAGFKAFRDELFADLAPSGPVEALLAQRVIHSAWRLRRAAQAEVAILHRGMHNVKISRLNNIVRSLRRSPTSLLGLDEPHITDTESHARASRALDHAYAERDRDEVLLGGAIEADAQSGFALGLLARYETGLERSLYRALHELRGAQAARLDRAAPILSAASTDEADGFA
jgi:hypothetical protein